MAPAPKVPTFEFSDLQGPGAPDRPDPKRPPMHVAGILTMLGVLLAFLLLGIVASGASDEPESPADAPLPAAATRAATTSTTITTSPTLDSTQRGEIFSPWPNPPDDRNPTVIGRPGPDEPIFGERSGQAVVYVNVQGRPTVVDLGTGFIDQVDIAPARFYDFFAVEFGRVVAFGDRGDNVEPTTDRALLFHVHRAGALISTDEFRTGPNPSPHLCISDEPCPNDTWTFERVTNGVDTIRRANAIDDPEVLEMLFGDSWIVDGANRNAPAGFGFNFRIPSPLNDEVWMVLQPRNE